MKWRTWLSVKNEFEIEKEKTIFQTLLTIPNIWPRLKGLNSSTRELFQLQQTGKGKKN